MGDQIPISAQVVSIADVYDALTSERCYKKAYSHEQAMKMIVDGQCGVFNPLLLECLCDISEEMKASLFENENYNAGHDEACQYMSESFEKYLNIEKEECTLLDDDNTFCDVDSGYAKVTYADGDCTEWQVLDVFDEL